MNFRTAALGTFATTALVTGSLLSSAPAQAITLAPGTFVTEGESTVSGFSGVGDTTFKLNFKNFSLKSSTGVLAGVTGSPLLASLEIDSSSGTFDGTGTANFLTGLSLNGSQLFVDLNPFSLIGGISSQNNYAFSGNLMGILKSSDGSLKDAEITLGTFRVAKGTDIDNAQIGVSTEVPTPALLPGLVGMGVAALRKRKSEELEAEEA